MEVTYSSLKQKDVINISDGKHLGKVCDIAFTFPEGRISGFTVTGGKGFRLTKQDMFIPIGCVGKIGRDAVLVTIAEEQPAPPPPKPGRRPPAPPPPPPCPPPAPPSRRSFDEYE